MVLFLFKGAKAKRDSIIMADFHFLFSWYNYIEECAYLDKNGDNTLRIIGKCDIIHIAYCRIDHWEVSL